MEQLKVKDIFALINQLRQEGMTLEEIRELPIYLGDDDELNGIHCGWYVQPIDADAEDEDSVYTIELINENYGNIKLEKGKAILIS